MMRVAFAALCLLWAGFGYSQPKESKLNGPERPKLVVGIVVDQMRWDFLYRYYDRYSQGGFRRLMSEGFNNENTMIPYTPSYTAAGHACVYTGSVPAVHGIMGNYWYSRVLGRNLYCTEDSTVRSVGTTSTAGKMSPVNMWTTTITDELRLATNFRSKVIGIAFKDRGSILPAGHSANAAYWFDDLTGGFISSTYYMTELPQWVKDFNAKRLPDQYLQRNWNTLYAADSYVQSTRDSLPYESSLPGEDNTFPHLTAGITRNKYNSFRYTPYANSFTFEMAKAAIAAENMGGAGNTDFLALSFSTPDYIGHEFGPNSIEIEDTYLRLDKDLSDFLLHLDKTVGKGKYTVFLTADHGVAHVPGFLKQNKIPAGTFDDAEIQKQLNAVLDSTFSIPNAVSKIINYQVYFSEAALRSSGYRDIAATSIRHLNSYPFVANAFELHHAAAVPMPEKLKSMISNGYNVKLSGDIQFNYKPQWFDGWAKGTSHGVWYTYDTHIPLLWYGWGIRKGSSHREVYMSDIAPTIAALLKIQMPSGSIGEPIEEVLK